MYNALPPYFSIVASVQARPLASPPKALASTFVTALSPVAVISIINFENSRL